MARDSQGKSNIKLCFKKVYINDTFHLLRILNPDICPTGALLWACLAFVGASHQLRRFFALEPKDEGEDRSIW